MRMCDLSNDISVADLEVMVRARRATILEDPVADEVDSEEGRTSGFRRAVREALTNRRYALWTASLTNRRDWDPICQKAQPC